MTHERSVGLAVAPDVVCAADARRDLVRAAARDGVNGIDYVEIDPADSTRLVVVFIRKLPVQAVVRPEQVRIDLADGRHGRALRVEAVELCVKSDPQRDDCIAVTLDCEPDDGAYRVCIVGDKGDVGGDRPLALDPLLSCADFRGDAGGRLDRDCSVDTACEPARRELPAIDYLARDYAAIRRSILDRLALTMPDWDEHHIPDIGMTIIEAMAYVADRLAYAQDAIGTEAFLPTARRRVSVRRHVRLVDHRLHEGVNARTWIVVETDQRVQNLAADDVSFITTPPGPRPPASVLQLDELPELFTEPYEVFEPLTADPSATLDFLPELNAIRIHSWGAGECCLPAGSTSATLVLGEEGARALKTGSILLFEEVLGSLTGVPADADPGHRYAVRLIEDPAPVDDVLDTQLSLVTVRWASEDALPFDLCLSTTTSPPDCRAITGVSVARGNVVLVDHGRRLPPELIGRVRGASGPTDCVTGNCPPEDAGDPVPLRPALEHRPVAFTEPPPIGPATAALRQDPAQVLPALVVGGFRYAEPTTTEGGEATARAELTDEVLRSLVSLVRRLSVAHREGEPSIVTDADRRSWAQDPLKRHLPLTLQAASPAGGPLASDDRALERALRRLIRSWEPRLDLLASGHEDPHLVVECDEDGEATIRFGDGELGASPSPGEVLFAEYRIGGGPAGNVGADAIRHLVLRGRTLDGVSIRVRNPMPATGGVAPETLDHARRHAPTAPGRRLERAITADDYAALARRDFAREVQGATGVLDWTGSWFEASVAVDERGVDQPTDALCDAVEARLERYRRMGHDLAVGPAVAIPLTIRLAVCVAPESLRGHVAARLAEEFGDRTLADGRRGFFHPDELEAGAPVRASHIVARALGVEGVLTATVETLQRAGRPAAGEVGAGILEVGPREIVRVEPGGITFTMEGGR